MRKSMNVPLTKREGVYTLEQIEATAGLTVTVWYTITGAAGVRSGVSMGPELAYGTSATQGKIRKPENDVLVLQDLHRKTSAKPNRVEKVSQWNKPPIIPCPEGHDIIKDTSGQRWLYRHVWDEGRDPKPVEHRIPINRITKINRPEQSSDAVLGGSVKELAEAA